MKYMDCRKGVDRMAGPLSGLKILDFTTLLPGPYATMNLADMGAEVLRIVSGSRPDLVDLMPPFVPGTKLSAASCQLGRNKKVMTLNLKDERAVQVIHKLITDAGYDIVIEQFRPGVMEKFGLDYKNLRAVNERLIYCSLTGYGQTGSMRDKAGHDLNYVALSGIASYSGKKDSGPPVLGIQIADVASGANNAIIGILAAVIHRQNTGRGQYIDVSMTDALIAFHAMQGAAFLVDGKDIGREETFTNGGGLYDYYETKDGRYLAFGGAEPQFIRAFLEAIGRPDLVEEGLNMQTGAQVKGEVREVIKTKTLDEWKAVFDSVDACCVPVLTLSEVFASDLVKGRNMVVEVPGPNGITIKQIACPIKFSESCPEYHHCGVPKDQANTAEIMQNLGYSLQEIEEFTKTGLFS
ncbi:L-carnitine dehydratase/bile acid-inducible protein F [Syntrophothermus lipocalidus DSM 12680]|uniref:L-carnitine dehydratase/bile acid-inducible protein F n=2 Tax=Syntrophothermus TaxID=129001 RepID=D7CKL9_SYNLT|nr:L-carnitine dehydratase/bile acid-inducible protein F [Syntrophothermus lipocalidus DSM 12680]